MLAAAVLRPLLIAVAVVLASWAVLVALAATLPPGAMKELAGFLPNCVTLARRLARDQRVPRSVKLALGLAGLWALSPIDLIPEFLPVIGPLDDVVVVALALRFAARRLPRELLYEAWPGDRTTMDRLLGRLRGPVDDPRAPAG
ncbi:MAG TPA: DUF1232 domain-containing protein [Mycobacteriales bacterium]|nr:DUF1232 domain-containing protein [Mycobacteriales bacterium]